MAKNWAAVAATVKRLIETNGRAVVVYKQGNTAQDSTQPWRGQADYPEGSVSGLAVFVTPSSSLGQTTTNQDNVKRADQVVYFAAANDNGQQLEDYDLVRDGSTSWKILSTQVLNPAGTRLLYLFEVAR